MGFTSILSFTIVTFFLLTIHLSNIQVNVAACTASKCVNVEIYYESLCPDSMRFIASQLGTSYLGLKEHLDIEFIPYGKATHEKDTQGKWRFVCQHGPPECEANKGQACGLEAIEKFEPSDKRQDIAVNFVDCAMLSGYQKCVSNILNAESQQFVENCVITTEGDELLVKHGNKTHSLQPPVSFIPTIVINRIYSVKNQQEARNNFKNLICNNLSDIKDKPSVCV